MTNKTISDHPIDAANSVRRAAGLAILFALVLVPAVAGAAPAFPIQAPAAVPAPVVADIQLGDAGGGWDYAALDTAGGRVLIARMSGVDTVMLTGNRAGTALTSGRHVHEVVPLAGHRILLTNGDDDTATVVDGESGLLMATVKTGTRPDAAVLDRSSDQVLVMNGNSGSITRIDVRHAPHVAGTIQVGGVLEAPALDGSGKLFINIENRDEIAAVALASGTVIARYKLADCKAPTGLAFVARHRLLVSACANGVAEVLGEDGVEHARLAIGPHPDAVIADPGHDRVFVPSGGDGTVSEISFRGGPHVARVFRTRPGARTGAYDPNTQFLYLPYGQMIRTGMARPKLVPGSFGVLVVDAH